MVINIPLQLDETIIEGALSQEYEKKVTDYLTKQIVNYISSQSGYFNKKSVENGLSNIVYRHVDGFLEEHKDEIISVAGKELGSRLARYKKIQEALPELARGEAERIKENPDHE